MTTVDYYNKEGKLASTYVNCTDDFVKKLKRKAKEEGVDIKIIK